MLNWLKQRFASTPKEPLWEVMEKMDPLLSYDRFQSLDLSARQRPLVKGLVEGTIKPAEIDAVRRWKDRHGEEDDGIDALVFALQHVLDGNKVTYLFEDGECVPAARFPRYIDRSSLTVIFNDRKCHLQIASLDEFLSSNGIEAFSLESLSLRQLQDRITDGAYSRRSKPEGGRISITIERSSDAEDQVHEPVGTTDIVLALAEEGYEVDHQSVQLESDILTLGLHKVPIRLGDDTVKECSVWVVPSIDSDEDDSD